jgi:hypothetical protein
MWPKPDAVPFVAGIIGNVRPRVPKVACVAYAKIAEEKIAHQKVLISGMDSNRESSTLADTCRTLANVVVFWFSNRLYDIFFVQREVCGVSGHEFQSRQNCIVLQFLLCLNCFIV